MTSRPQSENESDFAEIVRAHQAMVFSVALHFLGRRDLAEELAQDVFMQLYQRLGAIQSPAHLKFWLRKTAAHRAIDWVRREAGARWISLDETAEPTGAPDAADPFLSDKLSRLLASLPLRARMVVVLRYQEDLELHEIAETLEMPINTVKSSLQRSLALLRAKLARSAEGVRP